jgi:hypothetical protein
MPSLFLSVGICKTQDNILDPEHCRYLMQTEVWRHKFLIRLDVCYTRPWGGGGGWLERHTAANKSHGTQRGVSQMWHNTGRLSASVPVCGPNLT